jgi:hypothetical protein
MQANPGKLGFTEEKRLCAEDCQAKAMPDQALAGTRKEMFTFNTQCLAYK